jgi:hypothetical protein
MAQYPESTRLQLAASMKLLTTPVARTRCFVRPRHCSVRIMRSCHTYFATVAFIRRCQRLLANTRFADDRLHPARVAVGTFNLCLGDCAFAWCNIFLE